MRLKGFHAYVQRLIPPLVVAVFPALSMVGGHFCLVVT